MRSWSLAAAGASLVGSLVSLPAPAAAKARAHQAARPRAHGAPGVPFEAMQAPPQARPDAAAAVLDDRGLEAFMVAPHADDPSAYFDNEPYAAGAMHEELYARFDSGTASWMPGGGDATEEFASAGGDTLFRHGSILGGRHAAIHRRGQSSSYADTIAAMGAELSHNPKWLLQNPKWIPSWNRTSAATPVSAPLSATKTSSAKASKTSTAVVGTSESVPWVLPSPPSSSCASAYTNTDGGGVYAAQVGNVPWSPRPSTFVVRGGNKLYLDGNEFRIVGPSEFAAVPPARPPRLPGVQLSSRWRWVQTSTGSASTRMSTGQSRTRLAAGSARQWPSRSRWVPTRSALILWVSGEVFGSHLTAPCPI